MILEKISEKNLRLILKLNVKSNIK